MEGNQSDLPSLRLLRAESSCPAAAEEGDTAAAAMAATAMVTANCMFLPLVISLPASFSLDGLQSPVINVALILRFLAPGPNFGVKRSKSKRG